MRYNDKTWSHLAILLASVMTLYGCQQPFTTGMTSSDTPDSPGTCLPGVFSVFSMWDDKCSPVYQSGVKTGRCETVRESLENQVDKLNEQVYWMNRELDATTALSHRQKARLQTQENYINSRQVPRPWAIQRLENRNFEIGTHVVASSGLLLVTGGFYAWRARRRDTQKKKELEIIEFELIKKQRVIDNLVDKLEKERTEWGIAIDQKLDALSAVISLPPHTPQEAEDAAQKKNENEAVMVPEDDQRNSLPAIGEDLPDIIDVIRTSQEEDQSKISAI